MSNNHPTITPFSPSSNSMRIDPSSSSPSTPSGVHAELVQLQRELERIQHQIRSISIHSSSSSSSSPSYHSSSSPTTMMMMMMGEGNSNDNDNIHNNGNNHNNNNGDDGHNEKRKKEERKDGLYDHDHHYHLKQNENESRNHANSSSSSSASASLPTFVGVPSLLPRSSSNHVKLNPPPTPSEDPSVVSQDDQQGGGGGESRFEHIDGTHLPSKDLLFELVNGHSVMVGAFSSLKQDVDAVHSHMARLTVECSNCHQRMERDVKMSETFSQRWEPVLVKAFGTPSTTALSSSGELESKLDALHQRLSLVEQTVLQEQRSLLHLFDLLLSPKRQSLGIPPPPSSLSSISTTSSIISSASPPSLTSSAAPPSSSTTFTATSSSPLK